MFLTKKMYIILYIKYKTLYTMSQLFYAQKDNLGFPIPGTMMSTSLASIPKNTYAITTSPAIYQRELIHEGGLRYFVRKKTNGNIIANSLFINTKQPSGFVYELKTFKNIPTTIQGFNYVVGSGPSVVVTQPIALYNIVSGQTVTISHSSTNFQISLDGSTYTTSSVTATTDGSNPYNITLYIRLKSGLSAATYTETVTISVSGVSTTFTVSGIVS